ncbi:MAG: MBL fold metallo-hydrolase [Candidatus Obscuribacterales bacterium]|nr:MBL fold metallo-hydrolase [Candidatus Obscuribacterales bacterium]
MYFKQFFLGCLAHASYLIADEQTKIAAVVDPQRDIEQYLEEAQQHGFSIKHVLLTHFHADFLAGHLELRDKLGATIYLGSRAHTEYPAVGLHEGEAITLGAVRIEAMETPGHTPESLCFVVTDTTDDNAKPYAVLTGDTLFVGDVGRPDLLVSTGITSENLAGRLYDSLHEKLLKLPDETRVYPAHGAGSACGKNIGKEKHSTIGQERRFNYALQIKDKDEFVRTLCSDQTEAPRYFTYNATLNSKERGTLNEHLANALKPLALKKVLELQASGACILDSRNPNDFAHCHLAGSINIGLGGNYASWAGTVLDYEKEIVIVAAPGKEAEAAMRLSRIGYDNVIGYLEGGADALADQPQCTARMERLTAQQLAASLNSETPPLVLDVRTDREWNDKRLAGAMHIPLNQLLQRVDEVPRNRKLVIHCLGGYRSAIAASILASHGIEDLADMLGGISAWIEASLPVESPPPSKSGATTSCATSNATK